MAKNSIRDYSNTAAQNTDVQSINIDEGCSPASINDAIRAIMADLADINDGTISLVSPDFDAATLDGVGVTAFLSGTKMLFQQATAPTGWTLVDAGNDRALRVTNSAANFGSGSGGSVAFETAFANQAVAGTISVSMNPITLGKANLPSHDHYNRHGAGNYGNSTTASNTFPAGRTYAASSQRELRVTSYSGTNSNEIIGGPGLNAQPFTPTVSSQTFTGTAINMDVQYSNVIIASKD